MWPAYEKLAVHIELFGDEVDRIELINPTSGEVLAEEKQFFLFPAVHYVMPEEQLHVAVQQIREELERGVATAKRGQIQRSGSSAGRSMTWNCWKRRGLVRGLRITRGLWMVECLGSGLIR